MVLKIDYGTLKLQKDTYGFIFMKDQRLQREIRFFGKYFRAGGARLKAPESGCIAKYGSLPKLDCFMLKQQASSKRKKKRSPPEIECYFRQNPAFSKKKFKKMSSSEMECLCVFFAQKPAFFKKKGSWPEMEDAARGGRPKRPRGPPPPPLPPHFPRLCDVMKTTSPKTCLQNDGTKNFHF